MRFLILWRALDGGPVILNEAGGPCYDYLAGEHDLGTCRAS
jgi:hypothetical protein